MSFWGRKILIDTLLSGKYIYRKAEFIAGWEKSEKFFPFPFFGSIRGPKSRKKGLEKILPTQKNFMIFWKIFGHPSSTTFFSNFRLSNQLPVLTDNIKNASTFDSRKKKISTFTLWPANCPKHWKKGLKLLICGG